MTLDCLFRAIIVVLGNWYRWLENSRNVTKFLQRLRMKENEKFVATLTASRLQSIEFVSALNRFESPWRSDTSGVEYPCRFIVSAGIIHNCWVFDSNIRSH
jgi:hypothetical protein